MSFIRKHGLAITTGVGLGLIVLAANLQPQPARFWLLISGWPLLAWCAWIWSFRLSENNPYRGGFVLALMFVFFVGAFGRGLSAFSNLVFEPSVNHLYSFLTSKLFLASAAIYFGSTCGFYRGRLQEVQDDLRYCREMLGQSLDNEREENTSRPPTH